MNIKAVLNTTSAARAYFSLGKVKYSIVGPKTIKKGAVTTLDRRLNHSLTRPTHLKVESIYYYRIQDGEFKALHNTTATSKSKLYL